MGLEWLRAALLFLDIIVINRHQSRKPEQKQSALLTAQP
jgi:hypothetical protein